MHSSSQVLREYDVDFDTTDQDGNTALHVRCYGEYGKITDTACIKQLVCISLFYWYVQYNIDRITEIPYSN